MPFFPMQHKLHVHVCSGDVVTMECVEMIIRKNNMLCPISGKTLKERDIIQIVRVSGMMLNRMRIALWRHTGSIPHWV